MHPGYFLAVSLQPLEDVRDQVRARLNLLDVIQQHVRLRKAGREWVGLCPFHDEKTPSFSVNEQLQSWYCFGCQRGGDVFKFVELREKVTFPEALRILAEMAGVEMPERSGHDQARTRLKRRILELNSLAVQYYEYVLHTTPAGEAGRTLLEKRGVGEHMARRFGLGYAPGGANFASYLARRQRSLADAEAAGLVRRGQDFFQHRLVVPIRDERGQTLAFTGRTVLSDEVRKYVNTPETPAYFKGRVLFALDLARAEIERLGHAVLMEGQFDVIVAHQFGVGNAVASSGTALTEEQLNLLKRFTDQVVLSFDNDAAGRAAASRAIEAAQAQSLRTRVLRLPGDAKDPDEFLRAGGSWDSVLKAAPTGWEYLLREAIGDRSATTPSDLELALRDGNAVLARIDDPAMRDQYRQEAALWLGIDERLWVYQPPKRGATRPQPAANQAPTRENRLDGQAVGKKLSRTLGYLVQVLAVRPEVLERIRATLNLADLEGDDRVAYLHMVETLQRGGLEALGRELTGFPPELEGLVRKAWAAPPPSVSDDVVDDVVRRIARSARARRKRGIIAGLAEAERLGDRERVAALEAEWRQLNGWT
ncbi:DNA primase [Candidatus Nephthysia bennettiae]|uniref:DNA primase n=1 Tax=Candidatus Nephthysia bennettiae TaxID=3127016 RepID=A0A934NAE6_9BACT|nr:DNA primase [Candidatus Dormibacteraeota bacterium]MBJ7614655.1 DNA primase [Candidatus Dormibacteraeota bacterium]